MVRAKITDYKELERLVRETDMTVEQIGKQFGVCKGTASKAIAKLGNVITREGTLRGAAEIANRKLKLTRRLDTSTRILEKELKYTIAQMNACDSTAVKVDDSDSRDLINKERMKWQAQMVKISAEIRQQLGLLRELKQADYELSQIERFKELVLQEIGNASQEIKDRIIKGLNQRGSDSGSDKFGGQEVSGSIN
jgi:hypothetical protein